MSNSFKYPYKGDDALDGSKRERARKLYPLGPCEECGKPGIDRHHKDGNTGNNARENIAILCRTCHMMIDGRLDALIKSVRPISPAKPCANCGREVKPLRKGRCSRCSAYLTRTGREWEPRKLPDHGTVTRYTSYACRCPACREAQRVAWYAWFSKNRKKVAAPEASPQGSHFQTDV